MNWIFDFVNAQPWQMRAFIVGGAAIAACMVFLRVLLWLGDLGTRKRWREQRQAERLARLAGNVDITPYASEYKRREHPDSEILPCLPNTGGTVERKICTLPPAPWFEGLAQAGPLLGAFDGVGFKCANCGARHVANWQSGKHYFCSEKCLRWFSVIPGDKSKI